MTNLQIMELNYFDLMCHDQESVKPKQKLILILFDAVIGLSNDTFFFEWFILRQVIVNKRRNCIDTMRALPVLLNSRALIKEEVCVGEWTFLNNTKLLDLKWDL